MWKYLDLFLELLFSHLIMSAKFELLLLSISTVKIHAWCIMLRFVIFVLDAIFHIWSSSLDMFLVRVYSRYNKKFTYSTDKMNLEKFMLTHDKLNA